MKTILTIADILLISAIVFFTARLWIEAFDEEL